MLSKRMLYVFILQLIFCTFLFANTGNAQRKTIDKVWVTMDPHEKTLLQFFRNVESKTEFKFTYNDNLVDLNQKVSLGTADQNLYKILENISYQTRLNFVQVNSNIHVNSRNPNSDEFFNGFIQDAEILVSGTVRDTNGESMPGVSITVLGSNQGTVTDLNGNYNITVEDGATLVFSFIGFESQSIEVGGRTEIDVTLIEDISSLEEVVVVGYGTQKKINMTGAVDVISNEKIENRQASTVSQILQGQSPGLDFSVGNSGYEPGASMNINIRGMGSINGGSPFVLIDGFPGEMDRLNPNDIESISVLKDAAASAIYGARAPYGVILITTKSGRKNEKMTISYSGNMSYNVPDRLPQQLDSYTFARVINEMGVNGGGRSYSNEAIERIIAYQNEDWDFLKPLYPADATYFESIPLPNGRWGSNQDSHANYDWYDEFFGHSLNQQHNVSVRGGSEKSSYYLSAGYVEQNGVLNYGTDNYKRYNLIGKINTSITDWWDVRYETRLMKSPRELPSILPHWDYTMIFRQIPRTVPTQAKYTGYGTYNIQSKIPFIQDSGSDRQETTENWHTLSTEIRPMDGWKINGEFAYKTVDVNRTNLYLTFYEHMVDKSYIPNAQSVPNSIQRSQLINSYWTTNLYSSYDFSLGGHNFLTMLGMQYELDQTSRINVNKTNLIVPSVPSLQTANGDAVASEVLGHWATQGYFGRLTYNYNEKYLLEANARYDGTSRFQENSRWGFFPSFSLGWNLDQEPFWEAIENRINSFKIRGSWGQLGNQQVNPYQDIALIPLETGRLNWLFDYGANRPLGYTSTPSLVSPNLTWETSTTLNFGLNTSFFSNRLQFDFDLFERITDNMIGPSEPVPGVLGSSVPQSNNATLRTRGWETSIRWNHDLPGSGISYFINLNLFDAQSVVTDYLNPSGIVNDWYAGKEVGEIWGYTAHELYRDQEELDAYLEQVDLSFINNSWNPGDLKYLDINGDGRVNIGSNSLDDPGDLSVIGNSTPRYQWGVSAGMDFKGFDFSFLFRGTARRDFSVPFGGENYVFWGIRSWLFTALTPDHLDYYRDQPGDQYTGLHEGQANINLEAYWPKPYLDRNQNNKNRHPSTRYLLNASFIRLQNVQFGYNIPQYSLERIGLQKLRIFLSAENLFTLTDLIKGLDPTALGNPNRIGMTYGADKMISLGINASL